MEFVQHTLRTQEPGLQNGQREADAGEWYIKGWHVQGDAISKAPPWVLTVKTTSRLPHLLTPKTLPRSPGSGLPPHGTRPSCEAGLYSELCDVGQVELLRGKGKAMSPQVWAIRQQRSVTHKGRMRYSGPSFEIIAGTGNLPAY